MNWWILALPAIVMLPSALIFHFIPVMRISTYFTMHVPEGFRDSIEGVTMLGRFRAVNWSLAAAAVLLMTWGLSSSTTGAVILGPLLHAFGMLAALQQARAELRRLPQATLSTLRTASLLPGEPVPAWTLPLWIVPALILGGAAWYLSTHWDRIPELFPVHWGPSGQPDRWSRKDLRGVYGVLVIGVSTLLLCYGVSAAVLFGARRSGAEVRMLRAFSLTMLGVMTGVALLMAGISLQPLSPTPDQLPLPMWAIVAIPIAWILMSVLPMWRATVAADAEGDPTPDECWRLGAIYYNPDDPALMVRRRMGLGYTPNFARPAILIGFPLLLAQMFLVVFYVAR